MKYIVKILLIGSLVLNLILFISSFYTTQNETKTNESKQFPFISKRVFVEDQNDIIINFVSLRSQLKEYISTIDEPVGMYFEYLPSGVSIGIDEKENYVLASLLKVPLTMVVYKEVERGKIALHDVLSVEEQDIDSKFGTFWKKGKGATLTVQEAIQLVLVESDNTAKNMLLRKIGVTQLEKVFDYLDIPIEGETNGPIITPKNYASILRSLYLSSYLDKKYSNDILQKMTESNFSDKLVAGIPKGVKVSHKIGVYEVDGDATQQTYTDCGIVYVPKRPYILCLMTKSSNAAAQKNFGSISKIVYEYVSKKN